MAEKTVRFLNKLPLFYDLPDVVLQELAAEVTSQQMVKDEVLFNREDPGDAVYFVQTGWLKVVLLDSGNNELIINRIGPGEIIGEMALLDQLPRSAGAVALTPVQMLRLGNSEFRAVIDRYPHLGMVFAKNISERLRFNVAYLQNAVEWSYRIAQGEYAFVLDQLEEVQSTMVNSRQPEDARARQLLSAFFEMVKEIKQREDDYKTQIRQFTITLDEAQMEEDVDAITSKTFFRRIQTESKKIRTNPNLRINRLRDEDN